MQAHSRYRDDIYSLYQNTGPRARPGDLLEHRLAPPAGAQRARRGGARPDAPPARPVHGCRRRRSCCRSSSASPPTSSPGSTPPMRPSAPLPTSVRASPCAPGRRGSDGCPSGRRCCRWVADNRVASRTGHRGRPPRSPNRFDAIIREYCDGVRAAARRCHHPADGAAAQ